MCPGLGFGSEVVCMVWVLQLLSLLGLGALASRCSSFLVWVADYLPWTGWGGCAQGFAAITSWRRGWTLAGLSPEAGSKVTLVDLVDRQATGIWDRTKFQMCEVAGLHRS